MRRSARRRNRQSLLRPLSGAAGERFGRYEMRDEIGRGTLGRVYRAFDPFTSRLVALKLMRTACLPTRTLELYRRRLRMEAQAAGGLAHPNIVRIYDQGDDYLVMEFVDGVLLSRRLRGRRMGVDEALGVLRGLASALDYAHSRGVIHRDVKPRNVILLADGTPKLTDFGLASFPGSDPGVGERFLGHPAYLAPEHIVSGETTAASDLFSFGAIAYEMFTGHRAFPGQTVGAVIHRVVYDEPVPATQVNRRLPAAFDALLARMLDKDPARRLPTAAALVDALGQHRDATRKVVPRRRTVAPPPPPRRRSDDTLDLGRRARPAPPPPAKPAEALTVAADPVGATVWLDGVRVGEAPVALSQIARGSHSLRVMARGFIPVQLTIDITAGAAALLVTLQPQGTEAASGLPHPLGHALLDPPGRPS